VTGATGQPYPGHPCHSADPGGSGGPDVDEQVTVATAGQMRTLGRRLSSILRAGDLVVLSGPLGAGKTTLTQGIGAGLGVRGSVTSPTFVIARVHPSLSSGPDLVHADAYRLGSRAEVDDLDLERDLATAVTVVEWGEGLVEDLAPSFLSVGIRAEQDAVGDEEAEDVDVRRSVRVQGWGDRWQGTAVAEEIRLALADLG
jgi:tRNA threonylcarbamoyladenosine biosynthesis protein TsaE